MKRNIKKSFIIFLIKYIILAFFVPYFLIFFVDFFQDSSFLLIYSFIALPITFLFFLSLIMIRFKGKIKKFNIVFFSLILLFVVFYISFGIYVYNGIMGAFGNMSW